MCHTPQPLGSDSTIMSPKRSCGHVAVLTVGACASLLVCWGGGCMMSTHTRNGLCPDPKYAVHLPSIMVGLGILLPVVLYEIMRACGPRLPNYAGDDGDVESDPLLRRGADTPALRTRLARVLYLSHFLSAWSDRMWQFAVPMLFMEVFVDTLLPAALFGLVLYTGCIVMMPVAGRWVDTGDRFKVFSRALLGENLCVILSSLFMLVLVHEVQRLGVRVGDTESSHAPMFTWPLALVFLCITGLVPPCPPRGRPAGRRACV